MITAPPYPIRKAKACDQYILFNTKKFNSIEVDINSFDVYSELIYGSYSFSTLSSLAVNKDIDLESLTEFVAFLIEEGFLLEA